MTLYWKPREATKWYDLNPKWKKKKPIGVSGLVRVKNEGEFLFEAVDSHMPWLDEVRIILMPSQDSTEEQIAKLQEKYGENKVIVHEYRWDVAQPLTPEFRDMPDNSIHSFVYSSNWGMSQCRYNWVAKFEGDVIALSTFGKIREAIDKAPYAIRYYGRTGLNVAGKNCDKFSWSVPTNAGWDEGVCNNNPMLYHFVKLGGRWESINFIDRRADMWQMGMSFLHMKRCKEKYWDGFENEHWVDYTLENLRECDTINDKWANLLWEERI